MLQGIGWLFSGALKFFPGIPTIAVYALAALAIIGLPAGYAFHLGSEGKAAAVARCEASCALTMSELKADTERAISDILSTVGESGDTSENVAQYCTRNPGLCRTEGRE